MQSRACSSRLGHAHTFTHCTSRGQNARAAGIVMLHHHTKVSHVHSLSVSTMSLLSLGLAGKVAVVTGAAQGIGAAVARALAALGMKVAILDLESQRELAAGVSVCPCPMHGDACSSSDTQTVMCLLCTHCKGCVGGAKMAQTCRRGFVSVVVMMTRVPRAFSCLLRTIGSCAHKRALDSDTMHPPLAQSRRSHCTHCTLRGRWLQTLRPRAVRPSSSPPIAPTQTLSTRQWQRLWANGARCTSLWAAWGEDPMREGRCLSRILSTTTTASPSHSTRHSTSYVNQLGPVLRVVNEAVVLATRVFMIVYAPETTYPPPPPTH
jgi:hypothetical protein